MKRLPLTPESSWNRTIEGPLKILWMKAFVESSVKTNCWGEIFSLTFKTFIIHFELSFIAEFCRTNLESIWLSSSNRSSSPCRCPIANTAGTSRSSLTSKCARRQRRSRRSLDQLLTPLLPALQTLSQHSLDTARLAPRIHQKSSWLHL